ncbi:MAG: hypothetical protein KJZ91_29635 [Myxococcales bacterium]|nr:hypothetical protein [Myxococcales bacterium]
MPAARPDLVPRRQWTRSGLVQELQRLHGRGVRITSQALLAAGEAKILGAIARHLGSIERARALAQVELVVHRSATTERWSAARVLAEIRDRDRAGASLAASRVPRKLRDAAIGWCGSWRKAIEAAGLDYAATRVKPMTRPPHRVLRELRLLAAAHPELTRDALRHHPVGVAAIRRYGRLDAALAIAGVADWPRRRRAPAAPRVPEGDPRPRRDRPPSSLSRASTEGALRVWVARGRPIDAKVLRREYLELWNGILRHLGGINGARAFLCLPVERARWTRGRLAAELRSRHEDGQSLAPEVVRREAPALYRAAVRLGGSMTRAVTELVRTAEDVPIHHAARVLALIRARARDGRSLEARDVPSRLRGAARRYFRSWPRALAAAGLVVEDVVARRRWTDAELIQALRELARRRPALTRSELHRSRVGATAAKRFGSLAAALDRARLTSWPRAVRRPLPTRDEVRGLLRLRAARGDLLTISATRRDEPRVVKAALAHFGTWRAALADAGVGASDPAA